MKYIIVYAVSMLAFIVGAAMVAQVSPKLLGGMVLVVVGYTLAAAFMKGILK